MSHIEELITIINHCNDELWYGFQIDKAIEVLNGYSNTDWDEFYNDIPVEDDIINIRLLECMFSLDEKFPAQHVAKFANNASEHVLFVLFFNLNDQYIRKMEQDSLKMILKKSKKAFKDTNISQSETYIKLIEKIEQYCMN